MPKCCANGCDNEADYEVIFYDVYLHESSNVGIFYERHESCPFFCETHLTENERGANTGMGDPKLRRYRGHIDYPHAQSDGQGFCIYRPLN